MKKIFKITMVLAASLMLSASSYAQFEKGKWQLGGSTSLGFSSGKQDSKQKESETNINFTPSVGYFVINNLVAGLNISMTSSKYGDDKTSTTVFGPFVRYYTSKKIYGQLSYGIGSIKDKYTMEGEDDLGNPTTVTQTTTDKTSDLGISVGYVWMLTDNICIDPSLGYHATSFTPDGPDAETSTGSNFGLNIGITLLLGGK